jgi:pimeloyl-ACP methyl ester carboxylesterase
MARGEPYVPVPSGRIAVSDSMTLAVRRLGTGEVPLLLIHGFPCTSLIWTPVMRPLADAGFDVVAVDLRGYGESDFASDGYYDLAVFAADLVALCERLGWTRSCLRRMTSARPSPWISPIGIRTSSIGYC